MAAFEFSRQGVLGIALVVAACSGQTTSSNIKTQESSSDLNSSSTGITDESTSNQSTENSGSVSTPDGTATTHDGSDVSVDTDVPLEPLTFLDEKHRCPKGYSEITSTICSFEEVSADVSETAQNSTTFNCSETSTACVVACFDDADCPGGVTTLDTCVPIYVFDHTDFCEDRPYIPSGCAREGDTSIEFCEPIFAPPDDALPNDAF